MLYLTGEAVRVVLLLRVGLQILSFNAAVTTRTDRIVEFVVVPPTIRVIAMDVEIGRLEWFFASPANEAFLVVSTCQPAIG